MALESTIHRLSGALAARCRSIPRPGGSGIDPLALGECMRLFRSIVFDGYFESGDTAADLRRLSGILAAQIGCACAVFRKGEPEVCAEELAERFLEEIPELRRLLATDVEAVFDGDPAAVSYEEVILCYPALAAMTHYRFAHALSAMGIPILPRILTERAHSATGIDIHPDAVIGEYFAIDHGTGVVIGQTCIIGNRVRLYQGVTLGAKSFKFDERGNPVNEPRHPIIEDNVIVYSNASILGRIRIGHDSIIGGNVWQTTDLPPFSRVVQGRASVSVFADGGGI